MKLLFLLVTTFGTGLWIGQEKQPDKPKEQEAFTVTELVERAVSEGKPWLAFLDRPSLSCGIYRLAAGGTDGQQPHKLDEVYYVIEGKGKLRAGDETFDAAPGSILYVQRDIEHRFLEIEEDLTILVFFSKARAQDED